MSQIFTDNQKTVAAEILFEGMGLHSGKKVSLLIKPAPVSMGFSFIRSDLKERPQIMAQILFFQKIMKGSSLKWAGHEVFNVQCVLAALWGMGVDNAYLEVHGDEIPFFDGGAFEFCHKIMSVGLKSQDVSRQYLNLREIFPWMEDNFSVTALPYQGLKISFSMEKESPFALRQSYTYEYHEETFMLEIAKARQFYFDHELSSLKKNQAMSQKSLDQLLIIKGREQANRECVFKEELVRYKILNMIGDLSLLKIRLNAHLIIYDLGDHSNEMFLKKLETFAMKEKSEKLTDSLKSLEGKKLMIPGQKLTVNDIKKLIPHRYPFLLIDGIIETDGYKTATGVKNLTINEHFFQGHFPDHPIMPGVLILEAIAQTGACLLMGISGNYSKIAYFMSLDQVKFRKPVFPGDRLLLKVELLRVRTKIVVMVGQAYVEKEKVAEGEFKFALVDN